MTHGKSLEWERNERARRESDLSNMWQAGPKDLLFEFRTRQIRCSFWDFWDECVAMLLVWTKEHGALIMPGLGTNIDETHTHTHIRHTMKINICLRFSLCRVVDICVRDGWLAGRWMVELEMGEHSFLPLWQPYNWILCFQRAKYIGKNVRNNQFDFHLRFCRIQALLPNICQFTTHRMTSFALIQFAMI